MGFLIRNCIDSDQTVITDTDLTAYVNRIIVLAEYVGICWEVVEETEDTGANVTVGSCFFSCEDCARTAYQLTDCTGRLSPIFSTQEDLEDLVGSIIKVPYYDNSCFNVSIVTYDNSATYYIVDYTNNYTSCSACRQLKTIVPKYTLENCDIEKVDKIKGNFAEAIYQEVMTKRFGVKYCCDTEKVKWELKNDLIDYELNNHASPDFPEPIVEPCCIDKFGSSNCDPCNTNNTNLCTCNSQVTPCSCEDQNLCGCHTQIVKECSCKKIEVVNSCNCYTYKFNILATMLADATGNTDTTRNNKVYLRYTPCGERGQITINYVEAEKQEQCMYGTPTLFWYKDDVQVEFDAIEGGNLKRCATCTPVICPCKCTASPCSPHDCHTYTFSVVAEMLADAIGNTETSLNNKVFFGYIPCGETCSKTESYIVVGDQEYCVLGTPVLGWYKEDVWTNYDAISEGNLTRGDICEVDNNCDGCYSVPCNTCKPCNTCS